MKRQLLLLSTTLLLLFSYSAKAQTNNLQKDVIIADEGSINSFEELLIKHKGEKLYIDVWATYCSPCRKEFASRRVNKVYRYLKENGYTKIYLCVDYPKMSDKFKELLIKFQPKGYHYGVNDSLLKDYIRNYSKHKKQYSIPHYIIVDEEGNIVVQEAPRPSEFRKLKRVIKSLKK